MSPLSSSPSVSLKPVSELALQARIQKLQQELGHQIQRGNRPRNDSASERHASGLDEIDRLLGGGFPSGCLSEISGPASSGRTSLGLALLRQATRTGAHVAVVDCANAFDPPSAEALGVVLERVLWVRAPDVRAGLRCGERLLGTEGFPLVVMDFTADFTADLTAASAPTQRTVEERRAPIPPAAWLRLTRLAAKRRSSLILLSHERIAGSHAAVALEMQPAVPRFSGSPSLLEELETHAVLVRCRSVPGRTAAQGHMTKVKLRVASNAA